MATLKQVHDFAIKWLEKFQDQNINFIDLLDHQMADDCEALGFKMDYGDAFVKKYGYAFYNVKKLNKIIDKVDDIDLLASAIYSRWSFYQLPNKKEEILESHNRSWFITALMGLEKLTKYYLFEGIPKKVFIKSNNIGFGMRPMFIKEVEQHLTINDDGQVSIIRYAYGQGIEREILSTKNFTINTEEAKRILNAIAKYFSQPYSITYATDTGIWEMELTNTNDDIYTFNGSLCEEHEVDGIDLSDLIRESLGIDELLVFDGNNPPDKVKKITIDYHHFSLIKPNQPYNDNIEYVAHNYTEKLIIDRELGIVEHIQNIGNGNVVSHKYQVNQDVKKLLYLIDRYYLFNNVEGNPPDVMETPNEKKDYIITLDFKKSPQRIIKGTFDKKGLPVDWEWFAEIVLDFMKSYGYGEILNPSIYNKVKRRKSDYIYCSVIFNQGYKSYYYIADDDNIEVGDYVIVLAGNDNHPAIVEVVNVEYFSKENAPLPVEETKHIIRKMTDDDFKSNNDDLGTDDDEDE